MVRETIESIPAWIVKKGRKIGQNICADAGYVGLREIFEEFKYRTHIRPRGEEKKQLKKGTLKKARRWVIERLGGWINKFRGLLIRWNKKAENYYAMLCFACGIITLRASLCG